MKINRAALFTSLAAIGVVATLGCEDETFAALDKVIAASSDADCPFGTTLDTNFIGFDISIDLADSSTVTCPDEDFDLFPGLIEKAIETVGLSGIVLDQATGAPIVFDAILNTPPAPLDLFGRLRGRKLGGGFPYGNTGNGGCTSCSNSNCDDDTGADDDCRRRNRELFLQTKSKKDEDEFVSVKAPVENALERLLNTELRETVPCLKKSDVKKKDLIVKFTFDLKTLDELDC